MPCETDVAPKAISGIGWVGLEISRRDFAKSTFGANNNDNDDNDNNHN